MKKQFYIMMAVFLAFLAGVPPAYAAKDFNIKNNSRSFFYINGTSGNVGIGTTTPLGGLVVTNGNVGINTFVPQGFLDIEQSAAPAATNGGNTVISAQNAGSGNQNGGNIDLYPGALTGSGSVGAVFLQASGGAPAFQTNFNILSPGASSQANLAFWDVGTLKWYFGKDQNNAFYIFDQAATRNIMVTPSSGDMELMPTSGNVGIGSITPGKTLDVQGTVRTVALAMSGQTPISGYVMTASDSAGDTTWTSAGSVSGWTVSGNNVYETLNGNVGIGTSTLRNKLAILGNIGIGTIGYSNYLISAAPSGGMIVEGNVGIGTFAPTAQLEVAADMGVASSYNVLARVGRAGSVNGAGVDWGYYSDGTNDVAGFIRANGGNAELILAQNTGLTIADRLHMNSNGNIGISTSNPSNTLSVEGGVGIGTANSSYVNITKAPAGGMIVQGNVGVGSLTPGTALDVNGTARMTGFDLTTGANGGYVMVGSSIGIGTWMAMSTLPLATVTNETTGNVTFYNGINTLAGGPGFQTNGTNVGIGTSNFTNASLQIVGNIGIGTVKNGDTFITSSPPNGGEIIEGNVGIGSTAPGQKLDVQGNIRDTGEIVNGNVGIGTSALQTAFAVTNGNVGIGTWTASARMQVSGQYNSIRVNNGNQAGASMTIDWNAGNVQAVTLTGSITTLNLNNPVAGGRYLLEIKQGGAGSFTIAWPGSVVWPSATAPTLTVTVGQTDIITLYYNGTNYAGFYSLNYVL